jgi:hypothetical protein
MNGVNHCCVMTKINTLVMEDRAAPPGPGPYE